TRYSEAVFAQLITER
ncbi:unnamed protein product, partial [Didymodactylos carnosus]